MCSDMPMEDIAKDVDFGKKWMFAIALCLKKGLHLNVIHNLDRPFNEMMLGLESWIPIYMTGQVSPFYFKEIKNTVYNHLNYVGGPVFLTGECIEGYHSKGKYRLSNSNDELKYFKEKASWLLRKATPLMDIYRENEKEKFYQFINEESKKEGERNRVLSSLPLFTITDKLLTKILKRENISEQEIEKILKYKNTELEMTKEILKSNKINDTIYEVKSKNFDEQNIYLSLENTFCSKKIKYHYKEYLEHLNSTLDFKKKNRNYNVILSNVKTFNNITITSFNDDYVIISKNANPVIHFVIRHPKLVTAIKNFIPLVKE